MVLGEQELCVVGLDEPLTTAALAGFEAEELGGSGREDARGRAAAERTGIGIDPERGRMGIVGLVGEEPRVFDRAGVVARGDGVVFGVEMRNGRVGEERDEECAHDPNVSPGQRHRRVELARSIRTDKVGFGSSLGPGGDSERAVGGLILGAGA